MAGLVEGGPSRVVPLVHYDADGNRYEVGKAKAKLRNGHLVIEAKLDQAIEPHPFEFDIKHLSTGPVSLG